MAIRGAPAIGVAAAMGAASAFCMLPRNPWKLSARIHGDLRQARKTAHCVDLFWRLERMKRRFAKLTAESSDLGKIRQGR